ncbi:MAG: class IV adenylate cyclase [Planctomycetota bacterium]
MATNIEVKAILRNRDEVERRAAALAEGPPRELMQEDIFFPCARGRLKLRKEGAEQGQLIHYERPDERGTKASSYSLFEVNEPDRLAELLVQALGRRGCLNKERTLYLKGRTRIHLDRVQGLGDYMELEVVLDESTTQEKGHEIAQSILSELGIPLEDRVEGAYMDLLEAMEQKKKAPQEET